MTLTSKRLIKWFVVFGVPILMIVFGYIYPKTIPISLATTWLSVLFVKSDFEHYAEGISEFLESTDDNIINLDKNQKVLKSGIDSLKKEVENNAKNQENDRVKAKKSLRSH